MNIIDFLQEAKNKDFWKTKNKIIFYGKSYPFLFIKNVLNYLDKKKILPASYKNLTINSNEKFNIIANLQQSFLGQTSIYWLGEYKVGKTERTKTELITYLLNYRGPNFIIFNIKYDKINSKINAALKKIEHIKIIDEIDFSDFKKILNFFELQFNKQKFNLIKNIINQNTKINLDTAYMLIQYLNLISSKNSNSFQKYLSPSIIADNPSLNKLSQYFFSKNSEDFFKLWSKLYSNYSEMFWIAFWSEQIWKAYFVTKYLKQKNYVAAKSLSFRLPYSFIKKDWKLICLNTLEKSFNFLYNNDFRFKRGCNFCFLDLFYFKYFTDKFC